MPSVEKLASRLRSLERVRDSAEREYRQEATIRDRLRQRLAEAQERLRREEVTGRSQARARIRENLRREIADLQTSLANGERRYQRLKQEFRRRERHLNEELRYIEEMSVLQRIPLPREIVEMISTHNYRGRYVDAGDDDL